MRICPFRELVPGMMLGKSLFSVNGQLLLRAGYPLEADIIRELGKTGRSAIYIMEEGTEDIIPEDLISEEVRSRAAQAISQTFTRVEEAVNFRKVEPEKLKTFMKKGSEFREVVDIQHVHREINSIVDDIIESGAFVLNQVLTKTKTGYSQEHAIDTTLTCVLIGRSLLYTRVQLLELGMGAFLHDLGKLALPEILAKPVSEYTEQDRVYMREHPVYGQIMLANSSDRYFMAQTAILYHHERQDGLGYPSGVRGANKKPVLGTGSPTEVLFPLSEIIAVADAYDNLISGRESEPHAPEQAVATIVTQAQSAFNLEVVKLLAGVIAVFPTGSMVKIKECSSRALEGSTGAVMHVNKEQPHKPIIVLLRDSNGHRTTPRTIDLAGEQYARLELAQ